MKTPVQKDLSTFREPSDSLNIKTFTRIGLGTWNMEKNRDDSVRAIRSAIDEGVNHLDTAEMYGDGAVETLLGTALQGLRDRVAVVSKVLPSNAGFHSTIQSCEQSLKRLRTEYLDIYLLHWRTKRTPLEETFAAFEKLKKDGKIRAWGVSNFDVEDLDESMRLVGSPSIFEGRLVCNQVYYSIEQRAVEAELLPKCEALGMIVVAYSPLGQGRVTHNKTLRSIARHLNATEAQVALAFLIRNKSVLAIPKSSNSERARENARASHVQLTSDHLRQLDAAFPIPQRKFLPTV